MLDLDKKMSVTNSLAYHFRMPTKQLYSFGPRKNDKRSVVIHRVVQRRHRQRRCRHFRTRRRQRRCNVGAII
jgi:hypothetical protein